MDLATTYMGLRLRNPIVASASPLCGNVPNIQALQEAGAGAVVLPSVFEEQIEAEQREVPAESSRYVPNLNANAAGTARYLDVIRRARGAVEIPVIASLNGITSEGWIDFAKHIEEAGAHAIELNIYFIPADLSSTAADVERRYVEIVRSVRETVRIPIAVKLGPYFSALGAFAQSLQGAGADALVLFNRFYQPDIDLEALSLRNELDLSSTDEMRLPLLWIAVLAGRVKASLAASTGVDGWEEIAKYLLAGADVVMTTSALLRHGIDRMTSLVGGLEAWMRARGYDSPEEFRGLLSRERAADAIALERANYIHVLESFSGAPPSITGGWRP